MTFLKNLRSRGNAAESLGDELRELSEAINASEAAFNEVTDADLVEALIYERSALMSRYRCLMKQMRKLCE